MRNRIDQTGRFHLWLFTDADHAGSSTHAYSASGSILLAGTSYFPMSYNRKRQRACSRSTTEAETISLAGALYSEAVRAQEHLSSLVGEKVLITWHQDNMFTVQVIRTGWSVKLQHVNKTHKIDLTSLYDLSREPDIDLARYPTDQQAAHVFTQNLEFSKWNDALSMIGIFNPEEGTRS